MIDLGMLHYYLGVEVTQLKDTIILYQSKYIRNMLEKFNMKNYNSCATPMETNCVLIHDTDG